MTYIPDPIEVLENQTERQCGLVDEDGFYPCANCGHRFNYETMITTSDHPAAPLICQSCAEHMWG